MTDDQYVRMMKSLICKLEFAVTQWAKNDESYSEVELARERIIGAIMVWPMIQRVQAESELHLEQSIPTKEQIREIMEAAHDERNWAEVSRKMKQ